MSGPELVAAVETQDPVALQALAELDIDPVKVADNVELKFQRSHINAVLPKGTLKSI